MRFFTTVCVVAVLTGCASQPTSPAAPAASAAIDSARAPAGYKAVERNGTMVYCTKVAYLGTKFKQKSA